MMLIPLLLVIFAAQSAEKSIEVKNIRGAVLLDGKAIVVGAQFTNGTIRTGFAGAALLLFRKTGDQLTLKENSALTVFASAPPMLSQGMLRVTGRHDGKSKFRVRTPVAVMGVRGTDFMAVANSVLRESEIVVFDGLVDFVSLLPHDETDQRKISAGFWGGLGGRFGNKIPEPIRLPTEAVEGFKKASGF